MPKTIAVLTSLLLLLGGGVGPAVALELPTSAVQTAQDVQAGSVELPTGTYTGETVPLTLHDGRINRAAYKLAGSSLTSFQLLDLVRSQLEADGYVSKFSCADTVCGGFDFRFVLELLPAPGMFVDLGDFQYGLFEHPNGQVASIVASRAPNAGYLHLVFVTPRDVDLNEPSSTFFQATDAAVALPDVPMAPVTTDDLGAHLQADGHVALDDLTFETGSSALGAGPFASLRQISEFLSANGDVTLVLVGHSDNVGSLEGNITLSRKRAAAVRARLINEYGVLPTRLAARGVGYLVPRVSNDTEEGRENNRRVEAVIAPTR